jgi:pimeloyl-ACP methyl ester carboxylesterase
LAHNAIIDVRGCRTNVRRFGRGVPVLFLHGVMGNADVEPALDLLAKRFDVIAPDHPGFGRSDVCEFVDDVRDLSFFYLDVLDKLGLDKAHIVGTCLGGWIALELATHASHRVQSLTLVNSAGLRVKGSPRGDMFVCSEADMLKYFFTGDGGEAWMQSIRADSELEGIYERNRAAAAKFTWSPRLCNPKLDRWLHRIDTPTHIVWGARNRVIPPIYADTMKSLIKGASVTMIEGAAHLLHVETPGAFADEAARFIGRHS